MQGVRMWNRQGLVQICIGLLLSLMPISCQRPPEKQRDDFLILTPQSPETPQIHGAKVFGVRPNSPFLFQISATGKRPIEYSVFNLPAGLRLDNATGRITGVLSSMGRYPVKVRVENRVGATERELLIVALQAPEFSRAVEAR